MLICLPICAVSIIVVTVYFLILVVISPLCIDKYLCAEVGDIANPQVEAVLLLCHMLCHVMGMLKW